MKTSKPGRVVVISDHRDAHIPFVEKYLDQPFIVIDPQQFAEGKELSYLFEGGKETVVYDGEELRDVVGIWYRKPLPIRIDDMPIPHDYQDYSRTAMQRLNNLLLTSFQDAIWISDYFSISRASNKSLQVALAQQLGMDVPDTVITSDADLAKRFITEHPRAITKPLTIKYPSVKGQQKVFFTTLLTDGFVPDLSNLHLAPAIFQQAIDIAADIRVIVVGDKVFAAAVRAEGVPKDNRVYDYRFGHYEGDVIVEAHDEFPDDLAKLCVRYNAELGLRFGAFDFVLDPAGTYWFLENNPNGQWAFVEDATGQPIGRAFAELLQGK